MHTIPSRSSCAASLLLRLCASALLAAPLALLPLPVHAGGGSVAKPAPAKPAAKKRAARSRPAPRKPPPLPPVAPPEQLDAAERVFYGMHQCEFGQTVDVALNPEAPGYVNVSYGKAIYLMKPVLSTTGAVRLEDVRGQTLMVQITTKSMLMNVKAGQRLVDECISDKHREAVELANRAAAAAAAVPAPAVADGASAPAGSQ